MKVIKQARDMARTAQALRRAGKTIGFVPTMGALHDGHLALIRAAAKQASVVVVSIFVNPLQFGAGEDFEWYPRDLRRDLNLAKAAGCDLVFAPDVSQLYPSGFATSILVEGIGDRLEGAARPGHFAGVATIVAKLFNLVQPTVAIFGQKDYQQSVIIQRMAKDLDLPVVIEVLPTVREPDGLAMSSRNAYLSADERRQAPALHAALHQARDAIRAGERDARRIAELIAARLGEAPLARVDSIHVVNARTLDAVDPLRGRVAILLAVRFGTTRLIDNILVDVP